MATMLSNDVFDGNNNYAEVPLLLRTESFLIDIGEEKGADKKEEVKMKEKQAKKRWNKVQNDTWMVIQLTAIRGLLRNYNWLNPMVMMVSVLFHDVCVILLGLLTSTFSGAVIARDPTQFTSNIPYGILLIAVISALATLATYSKESCIIQWRKQIVSYTNQWYLRGHGGAHMHHVRNIETSDQRVTADAITMTTEMGAFYNAAVLLPAVVVTLSVVISLQFGWVVLGSEYGYFLFGIIVTRLILKVLIPKVYFAEQAEGAFRGVVAQACVYAESIAFSNPNVEWVGEKTRIDRFFDNAIAAQWKVIYKRICLMAAIAFCTSGGEYLVCGLVLVILLYSKKFRNQTSEQLAVDYTNGIFFCTYLMSKMSAFIASFESLSRIEGSACRIGELLHGTEFETAACELPHWYQLEYWLDDGRKTKESENDKREAVTAWETHRMSSIITRNHFVEIDNLRLECKPPHRKSRTLLKGFSFKFERGINVLITGPSGCGKTSLLRAMAGICKPSSGTVDWNVPIMSEIVIFAPQDPVCFAGTMKDNITYPRVGNDLFGDASEDSKYRMISWNEAAHNALSAVGLYFLLDPLLGLETEADWPNILSKGEVQRLGMARLFMFRPGLAVIDEATSGLQEHLEAMLYSRLIAMGTTIITVGHRESLVVFHDVKLIMGLDDHGSYEIKDLDSTWSKCDKSTDRGKSII